MAKRYEFALFPSATILSSDAVGDGNYDFKLDGGKDAPIANILNYFRFVDGAGATVVPSAGTVTVLGSPDNGETWLTMNNGTFDADQAIDPSLRRPSGLAQCTHARIVLAGIVGANGFRGEYIQTQGV